MSGRLMRAQHGYWPHLAALGYVAGGYALGLALITASSLWLNGIGTLLLAHALVIGAYLVHECTHNTIFAEPRHNAWLGEALDWVAGAGYGAYADIRHKHLRHHADRADVIAYDYRGLLLRHPWLLRTVQALEWAYIPAVDLLMHALVLALPFIEPLRARRRRRVVINLLVRGALFALLGWYAPWALLFYALAYMLFLHVMRFMDVHQHTYVVVETLDQTGSRGAKHFSRDFEQRNTYSNLISRRFPWLNLLLLNFGYHNAHHVRPTVPWYELPRLHREQFGDDERQLLWFAPLLRAYHRYRVERVLNGDAPDSDVGDGSRFVGVVGVSFLTAH